MELRSHTQCCEAKTKLQIQYNHQVYLHYFLEIKFITVNKSFERNIKREIFPCRYSNTL